MGAWDAALEGQCVADVAAIVAGDEVELAWKRLLVAIGPHIERWAARNRHLVRWGLAGEDDARTVLVAVLGRLRQDDYENLRRFLRSLPPRERDDEDEQLRALAHLDRLALDGSPADDDDETPGDAVTGTPLRGWMLRLVAYTALDHVRHRLGWSRDGSTKRAVGTDASPLSAAPEPAHRPPITDYLTVRRLHAEVEAAVAELPDAMRDALGLWLDDEGFETIATRLGLPGAADARKLVRAAQARLRHRFRDQALALR